MRSEEGKWDPATVLGLKSTDEVLVIGNAAFMPWVSEVALDITSARKTSEFRVLAKDEEEFDKVIISRETEFTPELVMQVGPLVRNDGSGLLVVFPADDGWSVEQAINFYYPEAVVRIIDTSFGLAVMANVSGVSWRIYDA